MWHLPWMVFQWEKPIQEQHQGSQAHHKEAEAGPSVLYPRQHDDRPLPRFNYLYHPLALVLIYRHSTNFTLHTHAFASAIFHIKCTCLPRPVIGNRIVQWGWGLFHSIHYDVYLPAHLLLTIVTNYDYCMIRSAVLSRKHFTTLWQPNKILFCGRTFGKSYFSWVWGRIWDLQKTNKKQDGNRHFR